jgi:hypothetical protein
MEVSNRQRAIEALQSRITQYQSRLNEAPVREQELSDLTRGYDQSRANYDSLLAKKNSSELATNLEMEQKSEHFRILDPPSLPQKPYSPNRLKLCGLGFLVGLALGGAIAGAAELLDDRVYNEEEVKSLVPVAILSKIPEILTTEETDRRRRLTLLKHAVCASVALAILAGSALSYFRG